MAASQVKKIALKRASKKKLQKMTKKKKRKFMHLFTKLVANKTIKAFDILL